MYNSLKSKKNKQYLSYKNFAAALKAINAKQDEVPAIWQIALTVSNQPQGVFSDDCTIIQDSGSD